MRLNIISLGAGVQSTTLLLMACHGEITPKPDYAIFADTGWEPKVVYRHLDWLKKEVAKFGIEVITTSKGNIKEDIIRAVKGERFASLPFYVKNKDGSKGMVKRQCTNEYKIRPVQKKIRELLGYRPHQRIPENIVTLWMGISTDEIMRAKPSRVKWIKHRFPLIEKGISRSHCYSWLEKKGYPIPPKSSCIGCPFHDDGMWLELKRNSQEEFAEAVEIDYLIKKLPRFNGEAYLHASCQPLDQVNLGENQLELNLFENECEGMCGV